MSTRFYAGQTDYIFQLNAMEDLWANAEASVTGKVNRAGDTFTGAVGFTNGGAGTPSVTITQIADNPVIEYQRWSGTGSDYRGWRIRATPDDILWDVSNTAPKASQTFTQVLKLSSVGSLYTRYSTDGQVEIGSDANGNIEIGKPGRTAAGTPFIDFHSSANSGDFDVRLSASGGTSTTGQGTLTINAADISTASKLTLTGSTANALRASLTEGADPLFKLQVHNGSATNAANQSVAKFGVRYNNAANMAAGLDFVRGGSDADSYIKFWSNSAVQGSLSAGGRWLLGDIADDGVNKLQVAGSAFIGGLVHLGGTGYGSNVSSGGSVLNLRMMNQGDTTNLKWKIAVLPPTSVSTFDHIVLEGVFDQDWVAGNKTTFKILAGNRGGLVVQYEKGQPKRSFIEMYTEADGSIAIWACFESAAYSTLTLNMHGTGSGGGGAQIVMYANPTAGTPTGTLSFSTFTAVPAMQLHSSGRVLMGSNTDNGVDKLQVTGNAKITGALSTTGNITAASLYSSSGYTAWASTDSEVIVGGDLNGSIEIGKAGRTAAGTPFIDFHSSANSPDFDARIQASGGTTTTGQGTLSLQAAQTNITGNATVSGNLTVNGTTTTVNSTTMTVTDPIITLGGATAPTSDDNKDRGVEFRWHNGTVAKLGFFGFDDSTGKFTFIPDATNTGEVFSGAAGSIVAYSLDLGNCSFWQSGDSNHIHVTAPTGLIPATTTTANNATLGTSAYRWKEVYGGDANFSGAVTVTGDITLNSTWPSFYFYDSDAAVDSRRWLMVADGTSFQLQTRNDANSVVQATPLSISRTGNMTVSGNLTVSGGTVTGNATSANKVNSLVTFNNGGSGNASGAQFDGQMPITVSWNTIGAAKVTDTLTSNGTFINALTSDLNTITTAGVYTVGAGAGGWHANGPSGAYEYGTLVVLVEGTRVTQTYYAHNGTGHIYHRQKYNAADWTSWQKFFTYQSGALPIANGGTNGTATPTAGAVSYGTGSAYAFTAAGTAGQVLKSNGASAPSWDSVAGALGYTPANKAGDTFTGSIITDGASNGEITVGGDTNGRIEIGKSGRSTAGSPYIDFHSAANSGDFDARISCDNGDSGATGQGLMTITVKDTVFNSTSSLKLPVGTTANRPTAATGQVRFNSTLTKFEGYDGSTWKNLSLKGPAFAAYQSTAQSVSANTFTKVNLQTEDVDTSATFDTTTSAWAPTVPGYYMLTGNVSVASTSTTVIAAIFKNGTELRRGSRADSSFGSSVSSVVYMNGTTDYVELFVYIGSAQNLSTGTQTHFSGHLVHEQ